MNKFTNDENSKLEEENNPKESEYDRNLASAEQRILKNKINDNDDKGPESHLTKTIQANKIISRGKQSERQIEIESNSFSNKENALYEGQIIDNNALHQNRSAINDNPITRNFEMQEHSLRNKNDKINLNESTIEKGAYLNAQDDSMMFAVDHNILSNNNEETNPAKKNVQLALKDDNSNNNSSNKIANNLEETPKGNLCRICYEGDTDEKGGLVFPCFCTGSCKYIHESCLKTWIENNFANNKFKAECEICKHPYLMKFYMKNRFSRVKLKTFFKSLAAMIVVVGVILALICTVVYVVVTALVTFLEPERTNLVNILVGVACGILVVFIAIAFRNCKRNFYEPYMCDWKIFNADGSKS